MASTSSLPSFSSTFADVPRDYDGSHQQNADHARETRKRRHAEPEDIKVEDGEHDELEPSPPPEPGSSSAGPPHPKPKRRRLSPSERAGSAAGSGAQRPVSPLPVAQEAANTLESMRTKGQSQAQSQKQQPADNNAWARGGASSSNRRLAAPRLPSPLPSAPSPAPSSSGADSVLPPLTSFSTRRRQSQNSAGVDKASKLSIRPPPSPYQTSIGSAEYNKSMLPAIHSAPPPGWATRQEQHHQQQQQQRTDASNTTATAGGLKLPVVPPVLGARPGMPDNMPRTAVPPRRPMFPHTPLLPGRLTGGPRTAGLPSMGPPPARPSGAGGFVQPIASARPSFGAGSSMGHDREKQAFLAPFESFYDTLADARRLKQWLADQLQRTAQLPSPAQYEARMGAMERELDTLRRRVAELEQQTRPADEQDEKDALTPPGRTHSTSAVRSTAPEPSVTAVASNGGSLPTPAPPGTTLSPSLRMVGPRISSPRAPAHNNNNSPPSAANGLKKSGQTQQQQGPARVASR
ncbi:hypothetical protein AURDEDRAFT_170925 [Auricularia subglabra TFB-10046 SS5]|nr:hypothetical protein AURDEDRAFT_170925 [Auricularia subglabra TFB-10046 SS5]